MNAVSNVPATRDDAFLKFQTQVSNIAPQIAMALPSHIPVEKFQRVLMAAVKADPELLKADRRSLLNACEKCAIDGLIPDKREAALVVFKRNYKDAQGAWQQALDVAYMPMVYGLRKKILQSGEITDITAKVVYRAEVERGAFLYEEGTEAMLRHRPLLDMTPEEATDDNIIAAYSMATYKDGSKSYEVMRRFEIDKVRECSQTGATRDKKGQQRRPSGPWVDWFGEQAKKTAMRRHSKTLPMSSDLVDVEGADLEIAARSTATMLSVEPDAPIALPSDPRPATMIESQAGTEAGVSIDHETGEVIPVDPGTGMTELDEDAARALDAGAGAGPIDPYRGEPWAEKRRELLDRFATDATPGAVNATNKELERHMAGFPDEVQTELDEAFKAARARVKPQA